MHDAAHLLVALHCSNYRVIAARFSGVGWERESCFSAIDYL